MDRLAQVNQVLRLLFDAAVDPLAWPAAINALADAVGATIASMVSYDVSTQSVIGWIPRLDPADIRLYDEQ